MTTEHISDRDLERYYVGVVCDEHELPRDNDISMPEVERIGM